MHKYEIVLIVDAVLSQHDKDETIKSVSEAVEKIGGKVINSQIWIEKQKMSFLMKKRPEGTYYIVNFEGGDDKLPELRRTLKLNDKVLRSLIIKVGK